MLANSGSFDINNYYPTQGPMKPRLKIRKGNRPSSKVFRNLEIKIMKLSYPTFQLRLKPSVEKDARSKSELWSLSSFSSMPMLRARSGRSEKLED